MTKPLSCAAETLAGQAFNVSAYKLESDPRWILSMALALENGGSIVELGAVSGPELGRAVEAIPNGAQVVVTAELRPRGRGMARRGTLLSVRALP